MVALEQGSEKLVTELCKDLNEREKKQKDIDENNIFHYACLSDQPGKMMVTLLNALQENPDDATGKFKLFSDLFFEGNFNQETPLHILAMQNNFSREEFSEILNLMKGLNIYDLMKIVNIRSETPFHISSKSGSVVFLETVLSSMKEEKSNVQGLLKKEDEDGNSALHLSSQNENLDVTKLILDFLGRKDGKEAITKENKFGWTPFSGAVSSGDLESLKVMVKFVKDKSIVNKPDFIDVCPLHLAAKKGHVDVFEYLINNGADITKKGPKNKTALDIAIEKEQRGIIQFAIRSDAWKTTLRVPSIENGMLDTPLRKLIRHFPDLAEEGLDRCYNMTEDEKTTVQMQFEFIEDT